MLKLQIICVVVVLAIVNAKSISGLKCDFKLNDEDDDDDGVIGEYYCNVVAYTNYKEKHLPSKTDNDVKSLWLSDDQGVTHFTQSDFSYCERFQNLYKIEKRSLNTIDGGAYKNCKAATKISIYNGDLKEVPEDLFSDNSLLTKIQIRDNKLTTLPENIFSNNKELAILNLEDNKITTLPPNIFKPLTKLKYLWLQENKIRSLEPAWFENLVNLQLLNLDENKITDLPKNVFATLVNLKNLHLNENEIIVIHADSFGPLKKLTSIDFKDNKIDAIDEKLLDVISSKWYTLLGNECVHKNFPSKEDVRGILNRCFRNYKPRV